MALLNPKYQQQSTVASQLPEILFGGIFHETNNGKQFRSMLQSLPAKEEME